MVLLIYGLKEFKYPTIKDAFKHMYMQLQEHAEQGLTEQFLTTIWIETEGGIPMFFNEIKEHAYQKGWLKDGKITI